jgi:hypothetical protein
MPLNEGFEIRARDCIINVHEMGGMVRRGTYIWQANITKGPDNCPSPCLALDELCDSVVGYL